MAGGEDEAGIGGDGAGVQPGVDAGGHPTGSAQVQAGEQERPENDPEDPQVIVRLIGQVVRVSVETVGVVEGLPGLGLEESAPGGSTSGE